MNFLYLIRDNTKEQSSSNGCAKGVIELSHKKQKTTLMFLFFGHEYG